MIVPAGVDNRLAELLTEHVKHGLLPCKCLLDSLQYIADFDAFYSKLELRNPSALIVGGRTFGERGIIGSNCVLFEDRWRFTAYNSVHNANTVATLESITSHQQTLSSFMVTIWRRRVTSLFLQQINRVVSQETKLILVLRRCITASAGIRSGTDGALLDWQRYNVWFDRIRSHMHTGFVTHEFETTSFLDLSYSYPYV